MDFFSGVATGVMAVAASISPEVEVGVNKYEIQPDGTWYQQAFPHEIKQTSVMFGLGFTGPIGDTSLQWHASYMNLGRIHSDSLATGEYGRKRYDPFSKNGCSVGKCNTARFVGDGYTHGIAITIDNARNDYQGIIAGGGVFAFKSEWKAHRLNDIDDWQGSHKAPLRFAPMVRVGYSFGNYSLLYTYIHHNSDRDLSALQRGSHVVSFRMAF